MEYFSTDVDTNGIPCPRGEICLRGASVFNGYYKRPDLTEEAIDADGWLHTGDVGEIHYAYFKALTIIDRVKSIFKLAQGEYIVPERLESIYCESPFVA
mmetsp:Transcript_19924/g.9273  ORF Transcript_19924/g.9273 Transcript_19924/m.9273 type:complete len:99 (+) Transcript_19924:63-359(+)